MNKATYSLIENYMLSSMEDSAHDQEHVYRVLYHALEIAKIEKNVDYDVLICACLLHDIGRKEQFENPALCHAIVGGEKAYQFLMEHSFGEEFANKVRACIQSHRYRKSNPPQSMEAKILFDADKIDVSGAIGIARTLIYRGEVSEPLYTRTPDGQVSNGEHDTQPSFFQEYKRKLEKIYEHFYTEQGLKMARERQKAAATFYNSLWNEVNMAYENGERQLTEILSDENMEV